MQCLIDRGRCIAIIPARGGSKGVPRKNIRLLKGFPLIAYSIAACKLSNYIDRVVISTDDEEIAEIAKSYGAEIPFMRPAELAADSSTDLGFVMHALDWFEQNEGEVPEYLVHIRPTTPLRDPKIVDEGIKKIRSVPGATSLRSAHVAPESPYKWFLKGEDGCFRSIKDGLSNDAANNDRKTFPEVYIPDGYVDVLKPEFILESGLLHGNHMVAFISPDCIEVDTEHEFELLEYEIERSESELYYYLKNNY